MPDRQESGADITVYLKRLSAGDASAETPLAEAVYAKMRATAGIIVAGKPSELSQQATSLVNVVLFELLKIRSIDWKDREHFFRTAARMLRRRFIDKIRAQRAAKRPPPGGGTPVEDLLLAQEEKFDEIMDVHQALVELAAFDPELAETVELVYFGGCPIQTVAEMRGVSARTISRYLGLAERWLKARLSCPSMQAVSAISSKR